MSEPPQKSGPLLRLGVQFGFLYGFQVIAILGLFGFWVAIAPPCGALAATVFTFPIAMGKYTETYHRVVASCISRRI